MAGVGYCLVFLFCGMFISRCLLPALRPQARAYIGLCLGLLMMMWLPALAAFLFTFSVAAHLAALVPLLLLTGGAYLARSRKPAAKWNAQDRKTCLCLACAALPLTALSVYLQCTHVLSPNAYGGLDVGQSTYGDLPLHLSIITGMRNASFPADYTILPGQRLCYPFLTDTLSTSFMLMGCDLRTAVVIPSALMLLLIFCGYALLCARMANGRRAALLAVLLFFLNGGLGFFYIFDMQGLANGAPGDNELQMSAGLWQRLRDVMSGWYQTPVNHAEFTTYNLRWSNVIADMLTPQRTTMGGWCMLLPCLYLLYDGLRAQERDGRQFLLLGLMAGALPMVHTHSYLALALLSAGWLIYDLCHRGGIKHWLLFAVPAALLALPQLLTWTFNQSSANGFIRFQFNWVNNSDGSGLRDGYLWFYIKNIGLPFILLLLSLLEKNKKRRFIASGAFVIFLVAEFVVFQPNEYDNNKLFYVWYMLCCVLAADYAVALFDKMKGLRARVPIAIACAFMCFFSGGLSIARECVSNYQMFSKNDVDAAAYIEQNTAQDSVFLTWTQHINPAFALAGRRVVCGPNLWLYWHGLDISARENDIRDFLRAPAEYAYILEEYGVDYIMITDNERYNCNADEDALEKTYARVYGQAGYGAVIYRVGDE